MVLSNLKAVAGGFIGTFSVIAVVASAQATPGALFPLETEVTPESETPASVVESSSSTPSEAELLETAPITPAVPVIPAPPAVSPPPVVPAPQYSIEGQWYCAGEYSLDYEGQYMDIFEENWLTVGKTDYSVTSRYFSSVGSGQALITFIEGSYEYKAGNTFLMKIKSFQPSWLEVSDDAPLLLNWQNESQFTILNAGGTESLCEATSW